MTIKLIALDLDGTTLNSKGMLTEETVKAIKGAMEQGVLVVIATGRVLSALPKELLDIAGLRYVLTSNGANIIDLTTMKPVYTNFIDGEAILKTAELLGQHDFMLEVFIDGHAYVEKEKYDHIYDLNLGERHTEYVRKTREPVEGLLQIMVENNTAIENININFGDQESRAMMRETLGTLDNVTLTTSFDHNLEIGGATTSKAMAIRELCGRLGIKDEEIMACGDSPNDEAMLEIAGMPVAMGNGKPSVKAKAKYITGTNDEDGVAWAIRKFVLQS